MTERKQWNARSKGAEEKKKSRSSGDLLFRGWNLFCLF